MLDHEGFRERKLDQVSALIVWYEISSRGVQKTPTQGLSGETWLFRSVSVLPVRQKKKSRNYFPLNCSPIIRSVDVRCLSYCRFSITTRFARNNFNSNGPNTISRECSNIGLETKNFFCFMFASVPHVWDQLLFLLSSRRRKEPPIMVLGLSIKFWL